MAAMNGANPLLAGQNLTLVRGGRQLFEGVSLSLAAGDVLLLRGPNGAGKSSLLLTLAGLLRPASGTIGPDEQQPMHLLAHSSAVKTRLTLAENLTFWRRVNGETGLAVQAALERVGLGGLGTIEAGHLSAGQTRRLALARLLVTDRKIWLLDEPLAALDDAGARLLAALVAERAASGGGVIAATHDDIPGATGTLMLT
jgi:heme exporter protein A